MIDLAGAAERFGALVLIVTAVAAIAALFRPRRATLAIIAAAGAALALLPVGSYSLLTYVYSFVGPLSAASLVLLLLTLAGLLWRRRDIPARSGRDLLAILVVVLSAPFYVLAVGFGAWDPYRLGFGAPAVALVLLAAVLIGWRARAAAVVFWPLAGSLLFVSHAYASRNLFDYLIDPIAVLIAAGLLAMRAYGSLRRDRAGADRWP